ncbi:MAG: hypothetical protein U0794_21055 [Isosphaeraceae bacterium]
MPSGAKASEVTWSVCACKTDRRSPVATSQSWMSHGRFSGSTPAMATTLPLGAYASAEVRTKSWPET